MNLDYCKRFILHLPETAHFLCFIEMKELKRIVMWLSLTPMMKELSKELALL